ncbi:TetR/AcrR family transcriptional regulator [Nocardioides bruguierae]|uniref:TetR/AcrR family transcriptional regulator n=1 Tax=Nocardioides bruguierae TaxID=2945102 RepID=A0A9X2DBH1_9ACTN|nr:TetR/AcrR family transcriptional regulator [Nocardioides bruguierae]MCM0622828.1 TetR/AcrR family transcriptional regulator [Nocardioides bruguierae]
MGTVRRRGAELETAILEATLEELAEHGYGALTFDGVAARAGTSKPVLYRRWPSRSALAFAAVRQVATSIPTPSTGSLAGDLHGVLDEMGDRMPSVLSRASLLGLLSDLTVEEATALPVLMADAVSRILQPVVEAAVARGELGPDPLGSELLAVPLDLARHDILLHGGLPRPRRDRIVDLVTVPLWRAASGAE